MKLALAFLATLSSAMAAKTIDATATVAADSKFGMDLLSKSRRVEDAGDDGAAADATWVSGYSLKFQGCHHIAQYNADAEGEDDVKIVTKRLIRFRLCPVEYCSGSSGGGCRSGYGDYIVDMDTFAGSYLENKAEQEEANCESYKYYNCGCDGDDGDDEEACVETCYANAGMTECYDEVDGNGDVVEKFDAMDYYQCAQYEFPEQDDYYRRKLEDANEDVEYFMGAYCSDEGSKVVLGLFTDEDCTNFADDYGGRKTYSDMTGESMPYSQTSIIDTECYSCADQDANGRKLEEVAVNAACEAIYEPAGKCESHLSYSSNAYPNEAGCDYMEGIKITRSNGIVIAGANSANAVANTFIGLFSVSFVLLGSYVYYLKTKLDRGRINLSD